MLLRALALVVVATGVAVAQGPPVPSAVADPIAITEITQPDGTQQVWDISRERLMALPKWNLQTAPVPLSLVAAVDVAQKWAARQNPGVARWQVVSAVLTPIAIRSGNFVTLSSWYYRVQFATAIDSAAVLIPGPTGDARRLNVVVLLDGSVVEPKVAQMSTPGATNATRAGPRLVPGTSDVYIASPGTGVVAPQSLNRPVPAYTVEALRRKLQGDVALQCVVDTEGRCQDIAVTQSLDSVSGLDQQAIKAAREYRFTPGTLDGKPVKVSIELYFSFHLK